MGPFILTPALAYLICSRAVDTPTTWLDLFLYSHIMKGGEYSLLRFFIWLVIIAAIIFVVNTILHNLPTINGALCIVEAYALGMVWVYNSPDGLPGKHPFIALGIGFSVYLFARFCVNLSIFERISDHFNHAIFTPIGFGMIGCAIYSFLCYLFYHVLYVPVTITNWMLWAAIAFTVIASVIAHKNRAIEDTLQSRRFQRQARVSPEEIARANREYQEKQVAEAAYIKECEERHNRAFAESRKRMEEEERMKASNENNYNYVKVDDKN